MGHDACHIHTKIRQLGRLACFQPLTFAFNPCLSKKIEWGQLSWTCWTLIIHHYIMIHETSIAESHAEILGDHLVTWYLVYSLWLVPYTLYYMAGDCTP
jgi:hypothetical protein